MPPASVRAFAVTVHWVALPGAVPVAVRQQPDCGGTHELPADGAAVNLSLTGLCPTLRACWRTSGQRLAPAHVHAPSRCGDAELLALRACLAGGSWSCNRAGGLVVPYGVA